MPAAARRPSRPGLSAREPSPRHLPYAGAVLVDSGPLIALFNGADRWHAPVLRWLQANPQSTLISTWCVATEVCALDFLRWVERGGLTLERAVDGSLTELLRLRERFASLPFDLADASVAEAAARLKIRHLISIDADFEVYRDRAGKLLINLLAR